MTIARTIAMILGGAGLTLLPGANGLTRALILMLSTGAAIVWVKVSGTSPLSLPGAIANSIESLTQYGLCAQASTPTPDAPVDIVCNNGTLRYGAVGKNLVNITSADIEQGSISSANGTNSSSTYRVRTIGYYPVKPNTQYTISCVIDGYTSGNSRGVFILEYSSDSVSGYTGDSSGWKSLSGYAFTTGATTNFIRIVFAKGSSTSTPTIPADISNIQLEYGDTATEYEPFVGGVLADGTPEVLTVSATGAEPQTASVPMLLSVGDTKDEAEIISGGVTRKVGIKVFDGTEEWIDGTNGYITEATQDQSGETYAPVCSHFRGVNTAPVKNSNTVRVYRTSGGTGRVYFAPNKTTYPTKEDFAAWLAAQYAAGTPVIVLYPLATETTESVTAQPLHTSAGDNTVSVTANVSPVALECEYAQAAPSNKVGTAKVGTAKAG